MTIASQSAIFSFAVQSAKIGSGGSFTHSGETWYKMRTPRVMMGTVQQQQPLVPELGGELTPAGAFKSGYFGTAEIDVLPRLEDNIGWLLLCAMGSASTVTGVDGDAAAVTNLNTHIFAYDSTDASSQPWFAVRRHTPGTGGDFGEAVFDCKVGMLRVTVPAAGKIAMRFQALGRDVLYDDASTWAYSNASFEDSESTPNSGLGQFELGGTAYPIVGATMDFINGLTTPAQEAIVGDYRPDDFTALSRALIIRIVVKWANEDLYRESMGGSAAATTWSNVPFAHETNGDYAFDARFKGDADVPTTSPATPFGIRFRANKVIWTPDGPPETAAGGVLTQGYTGTVVSPASGNYAEIVLENGADDYIIV